MAKLVDVKCYLIVILSCISPCLMMLNIYVQLALLISLLFYLSGVGVKYLEWDALLLVGRGHNGQELFKPRK